MKRWRGPLSLAVVSTVGLALIAANSNASKKCADADCNSPEHCLMRNFFAGMNGLASVFGDAKLVAAFPGTTSQFEKAANEALDKLDDQLPKCGEGANPAIADGISVGGETDPACTSRLAYGSGDRADSFVFGNDSTSRLGNMALGETKIASCEEIIDAVMMHENLHRERCFKAIKGHPPRPYPPPTLAGKNGFAADDAASYRMEANFVRDELQQKNRFKCSGDEQAYDDAMSFLHSHVTVVRAN